MSECRHISKPLVKRFHSPMTFSRLDAGDYPLVSEKVVARTSADISLALEAYVDLSYISHHDNCTVV